MPAPHAALWLLRVFVVLASVSPVTAVRAVTDAVPPPANRLTRTIDGIEFQFSPGQEQIVELLAARFARHAQPHASRSAPGPTTVPLGVADLRAHRGKYLAGIAQLLALKHATPLQEECFDAFLDNYDQTMRLIDLMRGYLVQVAVIKRVTVWNRNELSNRLERGEKIAGFSWDPATRSGQIEFGVHMNGHDDGLKQLTEQRKKLHRHYQFAIMPDGAGSTTYRASVSPDAAHAPTLTTPAPAAAPEAPSTSTDLFPVVIPSELDGKPAGEVVTTLWEQGDRSIAGLLAQIDQMPDKLPRADPRLAFLVLHETTEIGVIDRYLHSPDRRWFCDGVANYVSWRVVRDLHGATVAKQVYDLDEQLARYGSFREQADLRKWPAVENESTVEQHSDLDSARYAYATQAVVLMNARAGEDILPRLFREIGKTKPDRAGMVTVEKAWTRLTRTPLDSILAAVATPAPRPEKTSNTGH